MATAPIPSAGRDAKAPPRTVPFRPSDVTVVEEKIGRLPFRVSLVLVWYMRTLAIVYLAMGIAQWAVIIGLVSWNGATLTEMTLPLQAGTIYFAVVDLVAAIGLWLMAPWGGVVWLLSCMSRVMLHTAFMNTFGQENVMVAIQILSILLYLLLTFLADREERLRQ
jgi:Family of unknown function (DUF6163)